MALTASFILFRRGPGRWPRSVRLMSSRRTLSRGAVAEIELELKSGDRSELFALARQISAIVPAEISVKSKSERGYELIDGVKNRAVMAQDPGLLPSATITEAFQIICNECLHQLISNKSGVRAHVSEALHQARVALRRFDAAIKLFGKILNEQKATKVGGELKWIGDELAGARELDVFITDILLPLRTKHPKEPIVVKVDRACILQREAAYARANAALASQRFRTFLIDVAEWIETGSQQQKMASHQRPGVQNALENMEQDDAREAH
jgi:triphosphatase